MKSLCKVALISISVLAIADWAHAGRVNNRQANQRSRIAQGVKSGELTHGEAKKLRAEERHIRRVERRAKADGEMTPAERARIEKLQDKASHDIYQQKHDDQKRGEKAPAPGAEQPMENAN